MADQDLRGRERDLAFDDVPSALALERAYLRIDPGLACEFLERRILELIDISANRHAKIVSYASGDPRKPIERFQRLIPFSVGVLADLAGKAISDANDLMSLAMAHGREVVGFGYAWHSTCNRNYDPWRENRYDRDGVTGLVVCNGDSVAIGIAPSYSNPGDCWPDLTPWVEPPPKGLVGRLKAFARPENPIRRPLPVIFSERSVVNLWASARRRDAENVQRDTNLVGHSGIGATG